MMQALGVLCLLFSAAAGMLFLAWLWMQCAIASDERRLKNQMRKSKLYRSIREGIKQLDEGRRVPFEEVKARSRRIRDARKNGS